jgi:sec-independent protein translocase protein TatB
MFNIGFTEMIVIAALALILIGPKQLPEVARTIGRLLNELKRSAGNFTDEIKAQVDLDVEEELRKRRISPPIESKKKDSET